VGFEEVPGDVIQLLPNDPVPADARVYDAQRLMVEESALTGEPVRAICGKLWVPGRDPKKFPLCPACKEIYAGLRPGKRRGPDE